MLFQITSEETEKSYPKGISHKSPFLITNFRYLVAENCKVCYWRSDLHKNNWMSFWQKEELMTCSWYKWKQSYKYKKTQSPLTNTLVVTQLHSVLLFVFHWLPSSQTGAASYTGIFPWEEVILPLAAAGKKAPFSSSLKANKAPSCRQWEAEPQTLISLPVPSLQILYLFFTDSHCIVEPLGK